MMTAMSTRIEGHAKVSGPKRFVHTGKVDTHLVECFDNVMVWFDPQVSHPTQPVVHSLNSPVTILIEEKVVSPDESTKSSFVGRYITIIH